MSPSEKNPERLFFKSPKHRWVFLHWVDQEPRGKTSAWLEEGRFHGVRVVSTNPRVVHTPAKRLREEKENEGRTKLEKGNVSIPRK